MKQSDFRSLGKDEWRRTNVQFLRDAGRGIWGPDRALKGHYVELIGKSGSLSCDLLLKAGAIRSPSQFQGIDADPKVIRHHLDSGSPFRVARNDGLVAAQRMFTAGRSPCVMNYDGLNEAGNAGWWRRSGFLLRDLADRGIEAFGEFALILNHVLDSRRGGDVMAREKRHLEMLNGELYPVMDGVPSVDRYRSESMRMLTVRMVLRAPKR